MSRKTFFTLSVLTALIFGASTSFAQTGRPEVVPARAETENRTEEREERREEIRTQTEEKVAEIEARKKANLEKAWSNYANAMLRRFNFAISWLETMEERINSRIAKLKEGGVDTTEAEAFMASADEAIESAKEAATSLEDAISSALESENPAVEIRNARPLVEEARLAIRTAHSEMVKAITSLKPGLNRGDDSGDKEESENENEEDSE